MPGTETLAERMSIALGEAWGNGRLEEFVALFDNDAEIVHPYFKHPVSPRVAMEVMNAAVSGSTRLRKCTVLSGSGEAENDTVDLSFEETGDQLGYQPQYIGEIGMLGTIVKRKFTRLEVKGIAVVDATSSEAPALIDYGSMSSIEIAVRLGETWGSNDMSAFLSLFSPDARVKHVVLSEETSPRVVADVMNCNVKGTTKLRSAVLYGTGSGETTGLRWNSTRLGRSWAIRQTAAAGCRLPPSSSITGSSGWRCTGSRSSKSLKRGRRRNPGARGLEHAEAFQQR